MRLAALLAVVVLPTLSLAQVPQKIGYQGRLLKADGTPTSGSVALTFTVFDAATGGAQKWTETQTVAPVDGFYSVELGSQTAFPAGLFDGTPRFLEIAVAGTPLSPRQAVASVPYALMATSLSGGPVNATSLIVNGTTIVDQTGKLTASAGSAFVAATDTRLTDARTPKPGSADYIQNGTAAQSASFNVSGSGTVGGTLTAGVLRLSGSGTAPGACDAALAGAIYFDTAAKGFMGCDGTAWQPLASPALGTQANPALSCKHIRAVRQATDGNYWLDPNGGSPADAFQAYCDMTTEGGGWTQFMACLTSDGCAPGGTSLYNVAWNLDYGTIGPGSYLAGKTMLPILQGATQYEVEITHTDGRVGRVVYDLNAAAAQQFFFATSGLNETAALPARLYDPSGARASGNLRLCWEPTGGTTNTKVRSYQGLAGFVFFGATTGAPAVNANSDCDYGAWTTQMLIRIPVNGFTASWGLAGPATSWSASAQPFSHRLRVR